MSALKQFSVFDNPEKDMQELAEIKTIATQQLEQAEIKGSYISEEKATEIKAQISNSISEILRANGLSVPTLNIKASTHEVRVTALGSTVGTTGMDIFHTDYIKHASEYGLNPEWLGSSFIYKGKVPIFLTVTGLDITRDEPYVRFLQILNGQQSTVKSKLTENLAKQIGIAIEKYKQAFSV